MSTERSLKERTQQIIQSDPDVKRWDHNLNSDSTKRIYSESLLKFSEYAGKSPKQIIETCNNDRKIIKDLLTDFIQERKQAQTPKSVHNYYVGVKSWLSHNEIIVNWKINCGNIRLAPTVEYETPPSQEELARILLHADLRGKAFISLIAFAGLRPTTAVNVKLRDIPDLLVNANTVNFTNTPAQIKVKAQFSKNRRPYFTFLSTEGCGYVLEYLRSRIKQGEKLTEESNVLSYGDKSSRHAIGRTGFSRKIKRTYNNAGYAGRPYVLRSYFDTAILNSGISSIYQNFFMGHAGTIEATYTVNKNLSQFQINEMREQFKEKLEPNLETLPAKTRNDIDLLKGENKQLKSEINELRQMLQPLRALMKLTEQAGPINLTRRDTGSEVGVMNVSADEEGRRKFRKEELGLDS